MSYLGQQLLVPMFEEEAPVNGGEQMMGVSARVLASPLIKSATSTLQRLSRYLREKLRL